MGDWAGYAAVLAGDSDRTVPRERCDGGAPELVVTMYAVGIGVPAGEALVVNLSHGVSLVDWTGLGGSACSLDGLSSASSLDYDGFGIGNSGVTMCPEFGAAWAGLTGLDNLSSGCLSDWSGLLGSAIASVDGYSATVVLDVNCSL